MYDSGIVECVWGRGIGEFAIAVCCEWPLDDRRHNRQVDRHDSGGIKFFLFSEPDTYVSTSSRIMEEREDQCKERENMHMIGLALPMLAYSRLC